MKAREKHRKLFYVPGMISLLLLAVLCVWFLKSNRSFVQYRSVSFRISDSISSEKPTTPFGVIHDYVPKRNYKTITFNGNDDARKLKDLRVPLHQMVVNNDTLVGLKFHFEKQATYQTFIDAQDLLFIHGVGGYTMYQDDMYAFEMPRKKSTNKPIQILSCGYGSANREFFDEQSRAEARALFIKNIKQFWQVSVGLLVIILLNLYMLIKFNKNRKYNQKSYI